MAFVAVAIGGSAVLGGILQSTSAQNAANAQSQAADRAGQISQTQFEENRQDHMPWLDAGKKSLADLQDQMPDLTRKFGANDFQEDPGYQFTLNQGLQAMQRSAAAKGFLDSTGTMQNLNNYAQDMASNQYQNAYNRFTQNQNQRYNMLAGISGTGQTAAGQIGQAGMANASNIGNAMMGAGNAASAGYMAAGNNLSSLATGGANAYMNYNMMNNLFNKGAGGGGGGGGGYQPGMPSLPQYTAPSSVLGPLE